MRSRMVCTIVLLTIGALVGCSFNRNSQPPVHEISMTMSHYAGTVISAGGDRAAADLANAPGVTIEAIALTDTPAGVLHPLSTYLNLVTAVGTESTLLPLPAQLSSVRLGIGADAQAAKAAALGGEFGHTWQVGPYVGVLSPAVCVKVDLLDPQSPSRSFQLVLRPADVDSSHLELAITTQAPGDADPQAQSLSETAIAKVPFAEATGFAVLAPLPTSGAVLLFVDRRETTAEQLTQARELAAKQVLAALSRPPAISPERLMWESARRGMYDRESRRSSLVSLATRLGAPICLDLGLSADEITLSEFCAQLPDPDWPKNSPGWDLDKAAFDFMGRLLVQGKLSRELTAVLSTHAGEAGHSTLSMEQLVGKATSRRDFENRLVAENYIQLEEVSPAARVRAFDWLNARGKAPKGYDPMGSATSRRAALNSAIDAMSSAPAEVRP